MSLNAAALRLLAEKGLSAADIVEVAEALEIRRDPTAAERMRRHRAKKAERNNDTRNVTANTPPNDIILTPSDNPVSADADTAPFSIRVVEAWNAAAKAGLRKAVALDPSRTAQLKARAKAHGEAAVFEGIANLGASKFHCGENDRGWRASLGWFLKPENFLKALEMAEPAANGHAKPVTEADRAKWAAFEELKAKRSRGEITFDELCREQAKLNGEQPQRREATGPPRSLGKILERQLNH